MRYDGTRATLRGRYGYGGEADLTIHNHRTGGVETVPLSDSVGGHGGGDAGVMRAFVRAARIAGRSPRPALPWTAIYWRSPPSARA
jgi:hypothetical protein